MSHSVRTLDEDLESLVSLDDFFNFPRSNIPIQQFCPAYQPEAPTNRPPMDLTGTNMEPVRAFIFVPRSRWVTVDEMADNIPYHNPINLFAQRMRGMPKRHPIRKRKLGTRKIEETRQCCICFCNMRKNSAIASISCQHEFHLKCLNEWMARQENCPLCRLDLSE